MSRPFNILVLCTGNSARSILAEAILDREGGGRIRAYSAGSHPKGEPNPLALELLAGLGYDARALRSKSWDEFTGPDAPRMDIILTVCDSAAGEACPYWPGHPVTAHWGLADPAAIEGTREARRAAFEVAYQDLAARVRALVALPFETLDAPSLKARLADIGHMAGATDMARLGRGY